jgi:hypothetical protein|tara:strand:- start:281 stop:568 length:288 start_codon:yes stop_codon:yes gene_type:complete
MKLETLKQIMREVMDQVRDGIDMDDLSDQEIGKLIDYAMYEVLNPPKRSAKDRIISKDFGRWHSKIVGPGEKIMHYDDRPCDTEAPDNVIKVNFK